MKKGICILVESPDGAGKDTLIENIIQSYPEKNFKVYKFPSGKYREKIMEKPRTQLELVPIFCADFKNSISKIKNDLSNGKNIIINRMYVSTLLYSLENNTPASTVYKYITDSIGEWRPDLTVLVDIAPDEAFKRLSARSSEQNWLDGNFDKQIRINKLYKDFYKESWQNLYKSKDNIIQVDSNGTKEQTFKDFEQKYKKWLKKKNY